jgi:hypothetical protein
MDEEKNCCEEKEQKGFEAEEVGMMLDTISKKIPEMIMGIKQVLFSEEAGRELGAAVGAFYKQLVANGIDTDAALTMAKDYMASLQAALKDFNLNAHG